MIHPRGCAFIAMNRRQDAYKAMGALKSNKMQGRAITISWATGKGVKSKEWKDYWELDLGVSYIPWNKIDETTDFEVLEEGGMFDEDSLPEWLKEKLKSASQKKEQLKHPNTNNMFPMTDITTVDTTQPPPGAPPQQLLPGVPMVASFMGQVPRIMTPMGLLPPNLVSALPLGVPPPQMNAQLMMPPTGMVPGMPPPIGMDKTIPPPNATAATGFMSHFPQMPTNMPSQLPPPQIPITIATTLTPSASGSHVTNTDDHMDIEMEDEAISKITNNNLNNQLNLNLFSRPPPQIFPGQNVPLSGIASITSIYPPHHSDNPDVKIRDGRHISDSPEKKDDSGDNNRDRNEKDERDFRDNNNRNRSRERSGSRERNNRDRERDYRGVGGIRDRDRDNRNRDRGDRERDRDRDRRGDYNNRDRDRSNRWSGGRGRSRDNDINSRDRNSRDRDRVSRDRNDRDKTLQDRLREMAGGDNRSVEFNRRDSNHGNDGGSDLLQWRDGNGHSTIMKPHNAGPFPIGHYMDQNVRNTRPMNNMGPVLGLSPLDDMRMSGGPIDGPIRSGPMNDMRGPPPPPGILNQKRGNDFGEYIFSFFILNVYFE